MSLEQHIEHELRGKTVVLVGNAEFTSDKSKLIDGHDRVIRFNFFNEKPWFPRGLCGERMTDLCVNLGTGRKKLADRLRHEAKCQATRSINADTVVLTPYMNDKHNRLPDVQAFYPSQGLTVIWPDIELTYPLRLRRRQTASVGFYMSWHLLTRGIPVTIIGFTGATSKWHDGHQEMGILHEHELVSFICMDE